MFLSDLELNLDQLLGGISHLGPLRSPPLRRYTWTGAVPEDVGLSGAGAVQALLAARPRSLNWRPKSKTIPFEAVVATWLKRMGLISRFTVGEIAPESGLFEVRVRVSGSSEEVRLSDVGFGVSQVLPVIVQVFYAPANSSVLVEQPALHPHPAVQAALADLFVAGITAREDGRPRGLQVIVESHSEHLLRRLQRRIAEGEVSPTDVAIYFCDRRNDAGSIERLELDEYGDIRNWPPDFFGNDLEDISIQARKMIQRRQGPTRADDGHGSNRRRHKRLRRG